MTESTTTPKLTCVVHGGTDKEIKHSLRLTKDNKGVWRSNPACLDCRQALIRDAKATGKFIPFFSLEASSKEADKRNDQAKLNRPFLEKFGRAREKVKLRQKKTAKVLSLKAAFK